MLPGNKFRRVGDEFRQIGYEFRKRIRRLLIHPAYRFGDSVEALTPRFGQNLGVGEITEVETDYPFYRVKFPQMQEELWFREPELRRVGQAPQTELFQPGTEPREGTLPGTQQPGAGMPGGEPLE